MSETITMNDVLNGKDKPMVSEENRLKSFTRWPFKDGNCNKENMSSSGFYHCNIAGELDGVRCFCCFKELDGWEQTDDPWTEHKRNNSCYFANLGKPQNKLTVREFIEVIKEREINLLHKREEQLEEIQDKIIKDLGLSV